MTGSGSSQLDKIIAAVCVTAIEGKTDEPKRTVPITEEEMAVADKPGY